MNTNLSPGRALLFSGFVLASILIPHSHGASLLASQDTYIDGRDGYLDQNFGTEVGLSVGHHGTTYGGRKSYLLFDATGLPQISSIGYFQVQRAGTTINRTVNLSAILGNDVDTWTENGLTWNNAPGNNVAQANREFVAFPGESVIRVASFSTGSVGDTIYNVSFGSLTSGDMQSILDALNTGDRRLTLGLSYGSGTDNAIPFRSKDYSGGISAPLLDVTFVPEPAVGSLVLCGTLFLMGFRGRYKSR